MNVFCMKEDEFWGSQDGMPEIECLHSPEIPMLKSNPQ